ncbi:Uncharacterised protein [uncultured archaeon]|nr:Uncharacterised protein [uncultured archaeon]
MELYCFDRACVLSNNGERVKYIYSPKDKLIIHSSLKGRSQLLKDIEGYKQVMDDLISGKKTESPIKYLGKINASDREVKNTFMAGKYLELYKQEVKRYMKENRLLQIYEKKKEQMEFVFNSKVKSLVDLIK